jgi:microcystin-dependent protein
MPLRLKEWFFNFPAFTDRFRSGDKPTQPTMLDLCDSVPFKLETNDAANLETQGLMRIATNADANVRALPPGDNTRRAVQPHQLPNFVAGTGIDVQLVVRGGVGEDADVQDVLIRVTAGFADDVTTADLNPGDPDYSDLENPSVAITNFPIGSKVIDVLQFIVPALNKVIQWTISFTDKYKNERVAVGDIVVSTTGPGGWSDNYLEAAGQSLLVANYPELHALIGYTYGGAGANFNLPNLQGKMVIGQNGGSFNLNSTGGNDEVTIAATNLPQHQHGVNLNTGLAGTHSHTGTTDLDGDHNHFVDFATGDGTGTGGVGGSNNALDKTQNTQNAGDHTHTFTTNNNGDHSHPVVGNTDLNTSPNDPLSIMNPYFALYYKMRVK